MHPNVAAKRFPAQGTPAKPENVYTLNDGRKMGGTYVRADVIDPLVAIVRLEDGTYLTTRDHGGMPAAAGQTGQRVRVKFGDDSQAWGSVVRDGEASGLESIIRLDDGRHVLGSECEFEPVFI